MLVFFIPFSEYFIDFTVKSKGIQPAFKESVNLFGIVF